MESYTKLVKELLLEDFTSYYLAKENNMSPQLIDNYRSGRSRISNMQLSKAEKLAKYYYDLNLRHRSFLFNNETQLFSTDEKLAEIGNFNIYVDEKRLTVKITWDKRHVNRPKKETPPLELKYSDYRKLKTMCFMYDEAKNEYESQHEYDRIINLLLYDVCDYNSIVPENYLDYPVFI